ncbi:MAG: nitroreductase family protein [Nanoarchaeota archaeon]|nr:nitroreductase family protein [Nanoarchaeota archaeon]MBU1597298.1 nitroreductase family protein [Nanoarchaeota archaeon]MBU2441587.1 nitroreductase family protein [Nanoarchaeota archaeon]
MIKMDALECISTRRSIRRFLNVPVDFETIMTVVEAGSMAPSSGNVQDWKFIVIDDKEIMKKLCEYSLNQECIHNAAFLIVVCSDPEQTERHYGLRGQKLYTVQNCAAAAQNMLLSAHALGLGGNWVGAFDEEKIRTILNIPPDARPQLILAFGYPDEIPVHKRLKDLTLITYFNNYGETVKKFHRVLKDYSIDWEARLKQAHTTFDRLKEKTKKTAEETKKKGGSLIKKYTEKVKTTINSKKRK